MKKIITILFIHLFVASSSFATDTYAFRVYLKDKGADLGLLNTPEQFLSAEALNRRERFQIPVSATDLQIATAYSDTLLQLGFSPITQSRWFSTLVVSTPDSARIEELRSLPMVDSVRFIWKGNLTQPTDPIAEPSFSYQRDSVRNSKYGYADRQIKMLRGEKLHKAGFRGDGIRVAVIDAGFHSVDRLSAFDSCRILGTHNVLFPGESVFCGDDHGTKVLACLAASWPGYMIGTAPEASYYLIKSEDSDSEYPIEEDYWIAAVEYADSIGVDVISSSLGYFSFDDATLSYGVEDLDGKTALITQAAELAAEKGLLIFCSAGNEGNSAWEKITFPADAPSICSVGAICTDKQRSSFSSKGYVSDGRVKPDLVALGTGCCVLDTTGNIGYANGTSFAAPILAGSAICLWQALPWLTNKELITLLRENASRSDMPDPEQGYGLPDVYKSYKKGRKNGRRSISKE